MFGAGTSLRAIDNHAFATIIELGFAGLGVHLRLSLHKLSSSWERLLLLGQLLNDFGEIDDLLGLYFLGWQLVFRSEESFSSLTELGESVIYHFLLTIYICISHSVKLVNSLLRYPFIVMLLLFSQVTQISIHLGKSGRFLVYFLIGGLTFAEDAEAAIHSIAD